MALAGIKIAIVLQLFISLEVVAGNNNILELQNAAGHVDKNSFMQIWFQHGLNQNNQSSDPRQLERKQLPLDARPRASASTKSFAVYPLSNITKIRVFGLVPSYVGCYEVVADDSDWPIRRSGNLMWNTNDCMNFCLKKNRLYFALENEGVCKCAKPKLTGKTFVAHPTFAKKCGRVCEDESSLTPKRFCGNNASMAIYKTAGVDILWEGCFNNSLEDESIFEHAEEFDEEQIVTSTLCVEACYNKGYKYVALQGDSHKCLCGTKAFAKEKHTAVSKNKCGNICSMEAGLSPPRWCGTADSSAIYALKIKPLNGSSEMEYVYAANSSDPIDIDTLEHTLDNGTL